MLVQVYYFLEDVMFHFCQTAEYYKNIDYTFFIPKLKSCLCYLILISVKQLSTIKLTLINDIKFYKTKINTLKTFT